MNENSHSYIRAEEEELLTDRARMRRPEFAAERSTVGSIVGSGAAADRP